MMVAATWSPKFEGRLNSGLPNVLGTLETYEAGTSTPLATYTSQAGDTENSNPVQLDAAGRANVWLQPNVLYKLVHKTALGAVIWSQDFFGVSDPSGLTASNLSGALSASGGSSLVGFIQAAVGAYLRSLQDKARDEISLRDFIPAGVDVASTNCRPYIKNAMLAAAGKRLYIPFGEYQCDADVSLLSGTDVCGDGPGSMVRFTNPDLNGFIGVGINGATIRDLAIRFTTAGTTTFIGGVHLNTSTNCRVKNINLSGMSWGGVLLSDSSFCEVTGVRTDNIRGSLPDSHCIGIYRNSNYNNVHDNFCNGAGWHGIFLQDPLSGSKPTGNIISGNQVAGGHKAYGIVGYVTSAYDTKTIICGNVVRDVLGTALGGASGAGIFCQSLGGAVVEGNIVENCCRSTTNFETLGMGGISASVGTRTDYPTGEFAAIVVQGNHVDSTRGPCIHAIASDRAVLVLNNTCRSLGTEAVRGEAIRMVNVQGGAIRGNTIAHVNPNYSAIQLIAITVDRSYFNVSDNQVNGNSGGGIQIIRAAAARTFYGVVAGNNVDCANGGIVYNIEGSNYIRFATNHGNTTGIVLTMQQCPNSVISGNTLIGNLVAAGISFGAGMAGTVMDETNRISAYVDNSGAPGDEVAISWLAESVPPNSGYHALTERVIKRSASIGSPKGWRCTTAGNPGTWTSEGVL